MTPEAQYRTVPGVWEVRQRTLQIAGGAIGYLSGLAVVLAVITLRADDPGSNEAAVITVSFAVGVAVGVAAMFVPPLAQKNRKRVASYVAGNAAWVAVINGVALAAGSQVSADEVQRAGLSAAAALGILAVLVLSVRLTAYVEAVERLEIAQKRERRRARRSDRKHGR